MGNLKRLAYAYFDRFRHLAFPNNWNGVSIKTSAFPCPPSKDIRLGDKFRIMQWNMKWLRQLSFPTKNNRAHRLD